MVSPLSHSLPEKWNKRAVEQQSMLKCSPVLLLGGLGGADSVAAGALAAEEALRQAGIAAGEDANEGDGEGADGAVLLGGPWGGGRPPFRSASILGWAGRRGRALRGRRPVRRAPVR